MPQVPIPFCAEMQGCLGVEFNLPFGIGVKKLPDPCCVGIDASLEQLFSSFGPFLPAIKILGCLVKVAQLATAIPDALGPPPDPFAIADLVKLAKDLAECVSYLVNLAPGPGSVISFCKFIRDISGYLVGILECLQTAIRINVSVGVDVLALNRSVDPLLRQQAECLQTQNAVLSARILSQASQVLNLISLLNLIIGAIPLVQEAMEAAGAYPIVPNLTLDSPLTDTEGLTLVINILRVVQSAASACAGG